jgi:hypothetical protein
MFRPQYHDDGLQAPPMILIKRKTHAKVMYVLNLTSLTTREPVLAIFTKRYPDITHFIGTQTLRKLQQAYVVWYEEAGVLDFLRDLMWSR